MRPNENHLRALMREKIALNEVINVTLSTEDTEVLKNAGAGGMSFGNDRRITFLVDDMPEHPDWAEAILLHELLHTSQSSKNLWLESQTREMTYAANKLNEAEAVSINFLFEKNAPFFDKLKEQNKEEIQRQIANNTLSVPYADNLTEEQKTEAEKLYIETLATQQTMGQSIYILTQSSGEETVSIANELGISLNSEDLDAIEFWRSSYNNQAFQSSSDTSSENEEGNSQQQKEEEKRLIEYYENRYPTLAGKNFFKTGVTAYLSNQHDVNRTGSIQNTPNSTQTLSHNNGNQAYTVSYDKNGLRHGKETYYDENGTPVFISHYKHGVLDGKQEVYRIDPETQELYRGEVNEYKNGKPITKTTYYPNNVKSSETKYTRKKDKDGNEQEAYICKNYNDRGQQTSKYQIKDGKDYKAYWSLTETEKYETYYSPKTGELFSDIVYDRSTGDIKSKILNERNNPYTYKQYIYEKGKLVAEGCVDSKTRLPIGVWKDKRRNPSTVYYDGKPENGNTEVQTSNVVANPIDAKIAEGYKRDWRNPYHYTKTENGLTQHIFLNEESGCIERFGATNRQKKEVGTWECLRPDGSRDLSVTYDNGKKISSTMYMADGESKASTETINPDGTTLVQEYWGDKNNTLANEILYDKDSQNNEDSDDSFIYYHNYYASGSAKYTDAKLPNNFRAKYELGIDGTVHYGETNAVSPNVKTTTSYYPDNPGCVRSETVDTGSKISTTCKRKDGTTLSKAELDKDGNGTKVYFGTDGTTPRAEGKIVKGEKHGEWTYYINGQKQTCVFEHGKRVSGVSIQLEDENTQTTVTQSNSTENATANAPVSTPQPKNVTANAPASTPQPENAAPDVQDNLPQSENATASMSTGAKTPSLLSTLAANSRTYNQTDEENTMGRNMDTNGKLYR